MEKVLNGGHGLRSMVKNGTGLALKLVIILNLTKFMKKAHITYEFSTKRIQAGMFLQ